MKDGGVDSFVLPLTIKGVMACHGIKRRRGEREKEMWEGEMRRRLLVLYIKMLDAPKVGEGSKRAQFGEQSGKEKGKGKGKEKEVATDLIVREKASGEKEVSQPMRIDVNKNNVENNLENGGGAGEKKIGTYKKLPRNDEGRAAGKEQKMAGKKKGGEVLGEDVEKAGKKNKEEDVCMSSQADEENEAGLSVQPCGDQ